MYRILIVEDDRGIAEGIKEQLERWDFKVDCVDDFHNVLGEIADKAPHLILLDIALPFYNGFYWCGQIRKSSKIPILFLSSAADNMNMVMAMNMGADDFIPKPFDGNVLLAKIQALLRRTYDFGSVMPVLEHRGAMLNTGDGSFVYQDQKIPLSKNEFRILAMLMKERGRVVSRERLMEELWESDSFVDDNTLTVNVNRLRKKLKDAGLENYISTRFGEGYLIGEDA